MGFLHESAVFVYLAVFAVCALLAAMRSNRPAKPNHAVVPPPAAAVPAPARRTLPPPDYPVERREHPRLDRRSAYAGVV